MSRISYAIFSFALYFAAYAPANANQCLQYFPDPAASYSPTGAVSFASGSRLIGSDGLIDIGILQDDADASCHTASCVSSGLDTPDLRLAGFQTSTSSTDITVSLNQSATMNQVDLDNLLLQPNSRLEVLGQDATVRIDNVTINSNAQMSLSSGVYYVNQMQLSENAQLRVKTGHMAIVYVNQLTTASNVQVNSDGTEDQLVIIGLGSATFGASAIINAYIYVTNTLAIGPNSVVSGALNANTISLGENTQVIYQVADIEQANFNGSCGLNASLPLPVAHYTMDMCILPNYAADVINKGIEDSAGDNDADAWTNVQIDYQGKYCQGLKFDGNRSYVDIQDSNLFNLQQGSIALWVKVDNLNHRNNTYTGKVALFSKDTIENNIQNKLTLLVDSNGALDLRYRGSKNTTLLSASKIVEGLWQQVVVTWGSAGIFLYVDGDEVASDLSNTQAELRANGLDMAIAANALAFKLSNNDRRLTQLKDFFKGSMDELRIYDTQLNEAQIRRLHMLAPDTCIDCSNSPILISSYSSDVCSLVDNQVLDTVGNRHGTLVNGVQTEAVSRFCQGLSFDGNRSYVRIPHSSNFELSNGALSFWFKIPDLSHENKPSFSGNAIFAKDRKGYASGGHLEMWVEPDGRIRGRHQTSSDQINFNSGTMRVLENQWHHVVYTFGSGGMAFYIDGVKQDEDASFTTGWESNQEDIVLGATSRFWEGSGDFTNSLNNYLQGEMDDIKIYRNQASDADVNAWFNQSSYPCQTCTSLVAHYSFDSEGITGDFVEDISGNNNFGEFHRDMSIVLPSNNKFCRALKATADTANNQFKHFDSRVDPNDLGNKGGVSFWYRSNTDWGAHGTKNIIDATRGNKYFHLRILSSGAFRVGMEDINDRDIQVITPVNRFKQDEWVHIAFSWDFDDRYFTIIVNGNLLHRHDWNSNFRDIAPYGTLSFGDNKSTYGGGGGADGYFDDIRIYRQVVSEAQAQQDMNQAQACISTLSYQIEHPETALACGQTSVTLRACANDDCSELSADPTTLRLFPTDAWVDAEVSFVGTTEVKLKHTTPGTLNIGSNGQTPVAPVDCLPDCSIEYSAAGLEFFHVSSGETQFANKAFTAEASFADLGLRASGNQGQKCEALTREAQTVDISYECVNDANTAYAPNTCAADFAGIARSAGAVHSGQLQLIFNENGEANFSGLSYADVGILKLTASAQINGANVEGASTQIRVVPDKLLIQANAPSKVTAGLEFETQISAIGAAGTTLPSYRANELKLSAQRTAPLHSDAHDSAFELDSVNALTTSANISFTSIAGASFANGIARFTNSFFEEVGSYILRVQDADYLGAQIDSDAYSFASVIPAYFDVNVPSAPQLQEASGSFTYVGQAFGFKLLNEPELEIKAYNAKGQITNNYADSLWRLPVALSHVQSYVTYSDSSTYTGNIIVHSKANDVLLSQVDIFDGTGRIRLSQPSLAYEKIPAPSGVDASPFQASLSIDYAAAFLTDADGVCYQRNYPSGCDSFSIDNIGANELRYGRLFLENAFGPEDRALRMQVIAQYLVNGTWQNNLADSTTRLSLSQSAGDILILHDPQSSQNIAAGISGIQANLPLVSGYSQVNDLVFSPVLSAGVEQKGSVYVELVPKNASSNWSQYLNIDWDGDGDIDSDDSPSANLSFGLYRGNDKTIHWREGF